MLFSQTLLNREDPYIIAEIGNNHQGSLDLAVKMVDEAINCGVNAVKFQRRRNRELFTNSFFNTPYDNPNSFGEIYGIHREVLELDLEELEKLKSHCEKNKCDFLVTPFDINSLNDLEKINCEFYKIASADIVHIPLINRVILTNKPLILSTGHSTYEDIDRAVDILNKHKANYSLLHCTASYPTQIKDMNLNAIPKMISRYPKAKAIGLSDHENGIDCATIAYMLGARIFEKHFTLNRSSKGTDNAFSLEPTGMKKLIRNLKRIPVALGSNQRNILSSEIKPVYKMRKSIVYKERINNQKILTEEDLEFRCPGDGLPPYYLESIIGRRLKVAVKQHDCVKESDLE